MKFKVGDKIKISADIGVYHEGEDIRGYRAEVVSLKATTPDCVLIDTFGEILEDYLELIEEPQEDDPLSEYGKSIGIDLNEYFKEPQEECDHTYVTRLSDLVSICVKCDKIKTEEPDLKLGDKCLVWDQMGGIEKEAIYISHSKLCGYIAVVDEHIKNYENGWSFMCTHFSKCRIMQEPIKEVTKEEALEAWKRVGDIEIQYPRNVKDMEEFIKVKDYITNN